MTGEGDTSVPSEPLANSAAASNGATSANTNLNTNTEPLSGEKRTRSGSQDVEMTESPVKRQKGVAPIKPEYGAA